MSSACVSKVTYFCNSIVSIFKIIISTLELIASCTSEIFSLSLYRQRRDVMTNRTSETRRDCRNALSKVVQVSSVTVEAILSRASGPREGSTNFQRAIHDDDTRTASSGASVALSAASKCGTRLD